MNGWIQPSGWHNLSPDILEHIFSFLKSPTSQTLLLRQRLVCSSWRDVIDCRFKFNMIVNETKSDMTKLTHLKAESMIISCLWNAKIELEVPFLRDPSLLLSLNFWGPIRARNFQIILSNATKLEKLSLNSKALGYEALMDPVPPTLVEIQDFGCWRSIQSLELSYPSLEDWLQFLVQTMPQLRTLKLDILPFDVYRCNITEQKTQTAWKALKSFLETCCPRLTTLRVRSKESFTRRENLLPFAPVFKGSNQLDTLRFITKHSMICLWIPIINVQKSLKNLRIRLLSSDDSETPQLELCLLSRLRETIIVNQSSLQILDLQGIHLDSELNVEIYFGEMSNLKQLVIHIDKNSAVNYLSNLCFLPESLELLNLRGIRSRSQQDFMGMVDNLSKIKYVQLEDVNVNGIGTRMPKEVVDGFSSKPDIRELKISYVYLRKSDCQIENGKIFYKTPNGKKIQVVDGYQIDCNFK